MLLDTKGEIIEDVWAMAQDTLPQQGHVIVPIDRLDEVGPNVTLGVHIANDTDPEHLVPYFDRLALIAINFPSFSDGRGFSLAQRLRELGFRGCLRASGPVIADQYKHLIGCGFDEIAVAPNVAARQPQEQWLAQLNRISMGYQRGRAGLSSILDQRWKKSNG